MVDQHWTVIGLRDNTTGRITVAGVAAGDVPMQDSDAGPENAQRYATVVLAPDADTAVDMVAATSPDGG